MEEGPSVQAPGAGCQGQLSQASQPGNWLLPDQAVPFRERELGDQYRCPPRGPRELCLQVKPPATSSLWAVTLGQFLHLSWEPVKLDGL